MASTHYSYGNPEEQAVSDQVYEEYQNVKSSLARTKRRLGSLGAANVGEMIFSEQGYGSYYLITKEGRVCSIAYGDGTYSKRSRSDGTHTLIEIKFADEREPLCVSAQELLAMAAEARECSLPPLRIEGPHRPCSRMTALNMLEHEALIVTKNILGNDSLPPVYLGKLDKWTVGERSVGLVAAGHLSTYGVADKVAFELESTHEAELLYHGKQERATLLLGRRDATKHVYAVGLARDHRPVASHVMCEKDGGMVRAKLLLFTLPLFARGHAHGTVAELVTVSR